MAPEIISAIIGGIAGLMSAYIKQLWDFHKTNMELSAQHRAEIVKRQLDAFEAIWSIFDAASSTGGDGRMIQEIDGQHTLSIEECKKFIRKLEETFNGKSGLYISKKCREHLFAFRDHIKKECLAPAGQAAHIQITNSGILKFHELRRNARLCLRGEIGTTDLKVAKEEFGRHKNSGA